MTIELNNKRSPEDQIVQQIDETLNIFAPQLKIIIRNLAMTNPQEVAVGAVFVQDIEPAFWQVLVQKELSKWVKQNPEEAAEKLNAQFTNATEKIDLDDPETELLFLPEIGQEHEITYLPTLKTKKGYKTLNETCADMGITFALHFVPTKKKASIAISFHSDGGPILYKVSANSNQESENIFSPDEF